MELEVRDYSCYAQPQHDMVGHIKSVCDDFCYKFTTGIHFLTGEIDIGAWSFVYSLVNDTKDVHVHYKSLMLNGSPVDLSEVQKQSFHVGQYNSYGKKAFKSVIAESLKTSKSSCSYNELIEKYGFIDAPTERWQMDCVNQKIWFISPLIGLALKKKVFVFPWLSKKEYIGTYLQRAFDLLINEDIITIVPCSEKIQFPIGDKYNVVNMSSLFNCLGDGSV